MHAFYASAERTLCNRRRPEKEPGSPLPTCDVCMTTASTASTTAADTATSSSRSETVALITDRFAAMRADIDRMERELLDALEAEAA